jgi:hypothetical protein
MLGIRPADGGAHSCYEDDRNVENYYAAFAFDPTGFGSTRLDEALYELERGVGDFPPAAVDRKRMSAVRDLLDLGHAPVPLLPLE